LPSHRTLDEVAYRAVIIGFPIFATMIILGSWWASIAWGRYWGWDPKETAALVTWLIYAVYLHARTARGWTGRPAAMILVIGFAAVLFTYFGNLYFSGLHAYSGLD
jgi:cytochrome c-type biogenesis protein CcsB